MTPTTSGDLLIQYAARTQTIAANSYAAGSQASITWAKLDGSSDRFHGAIAQWGIYNSTSAINPTLSWASGSAGATVALAFKSAAQGTAATGMHIVAIEHFTTANGITGPFAIDLPSSSANNLIVFAEQGGGVTPMTVSSITDSNANSWTTTGPTVVTAPNAPAFATWYTANPTLSPTMTLAINTSGTGDVGGLFYIIAGALPSPFTARVTGSPYQSSPGNLNMVNIVPGNSSGWLSLPWAFTIIRSAVSSVLPALCSTLIPTAGRQSAVRSQWMKTTDGVAHNSNNNSENWTWSFWNSSLAALQVGGEANSFAGTTSIPTPTPHKPVISGSPSGWRDWRTLLGRP